MAITHILTGGFLAGRRTYILVGLAVLTELSRWAIGDQSLGAVLDHLPNIFGELSIAALRAGVASTEPVVAVLEETAVPGAIPPHEQAALIGEIRDALNKKEPVTDLIEAFKDAHNRHPFLAIEISYYRRTDWCVQVRDAEGVELKNATTIILAQDYHADEAFKEAAVKLRGMA